ncbi:MAG: type-F conjugative transfer system secretin TraK [Candidatus Omnitrophica bacterium]|nr:type-F conjugative transfer system secretin TraK [Candidatus Omnitrophota bacterium]
MRRINKRVALFMLGCMVCMPYAQADQQINAEGSYAVRAAAGKAVEIVCEAGLANLVRSGDPATLKVEHASGHLFVTPLGAPVAELVIMDIRGRSYRFRFVLEGPADDKIVIAGARSVEPAEGTGTPGIIRDLVLGRVPAGAVERKSDEVVFDDGKIVLRMMALYELPQVVAYVMSAENRLKTSVVMPIEEIALPGMLAVSAEKDILAAEGAEGSIIKVYAVVAR